MHRTYGQSNLSKSELNYVPVLISSLKLILTSHLLTRVQKTSNKSVYETYLSGQYATEIFPLMTVFITIEILVTGQRFIAY
jgi:hypothetical protein